MKTLTPGLRAHLDEGETTLAWCWRVTRRDGAVLGFTDHDRDLVFEGTLFEAATGLEASELSGNVGLGVDNFEVSGALSSDRLTEADMAAGFYDDATVEVYRVDWQEPENRVLMRTGTLGEVSRAATGFKAEVRGLAHYLQQTTGRLFQYGCDADLGDERCGVDIELHEAVATVEEVLSPRRFTAPGLAGFSSGHFARGLVAFTSGAAAGQRIEVKSHTRSGGAVTIETWAAVRSPFEAGAAFTITAGCDKAFETCRSKFANAENFRGFPHMPGNDFVASHAKRPGTRR